MIDLEFYLNKIENNKFIPNPPTHLMERVGGGDFRQIGVGILRNLIEQGKITHNTNVLEIGCGSGRIAIPLTQWVEQYTGFDIGKTEIEWCQQNISKNYNNFKFLYLDMYNHFYNPTGKMQVNDFSIPYNNFDIVVFCSVFTHLVAKDTETYFEIIKNYLINKGRIWSTWFVVDDEARELISNNQSTINLLLDNDSTFYLDKEKVSTLSIGYDLNYVQNVFKTNGFIIEYFEKGNWCGRKHNGSYQDIIMAKLN